MIPRLDQKDTAGDSELRKKRIGSSDAAAVLGQSGWKTPREIWEEKAGLKERSSRWNESMYWGVSLEEAVLKRWESQHEDRKLLPFDPKNASSPGMLTHPDGSLRAGCHLDGFGEDETGQRCIIEAKTSLSPFTSGEYPRPEYKAQAQHQSMIATALQPDDGPIPVYIATLKAGPRYLEHRVSGNPIMWEWMVDRYREFWECVEHKIPPKWRSKKLESVAGKVMRLPADSPFAEVGQKLIDTKRQIRELKKEEQSLAQELKDVMAETEVMVSSRWEAKFKPANPTTQWKRAFYQLADETRQDDLTKNAIISSSNYRGRRFTIKALR